MLGDGGGDVSEAVGSGGDGVGALFKRSVVGAYHQVTLLKLVQSDHIGHKELTKAA